MSAIEAASSSSAKENDAPPLDDRMAAIDASATASSSHMAAIDARATASSSATPPAPLERFEATVVRWRRLGKRFVFMDVRRDGSAEEWQLSCDANTFAGAERAAVVRVDARDEPNPSKRGLRALRCEAVATVREMGRDEDTKLVVPRDPRDVLCKLWARGACRNPRCPYRHAFATDGEKRWSEGAKLRRLAELRREGDARDPWAERAEDASRSHKNANFDDAEKRAHAARHSEFATWLLDTFGRATLEKGPILDVAGGKGALAWELQCVHGIDCVTLDPRFRKPLCRRRRKLLRKRAAGSNGAAAREPGHVRGLLDSVFEASPEGRSLLAGCSAVVGLHADEASEAIVDAGLKYGKPFAVVPCCVFRDLFPALRKADVASHADFCDYLLQKDAGVGMGFLRCVGKNKVIYRATAAAPRPDVVLAQPEDPLYLPAGARLERQRNPEDPLHRPEDAGG